MKKIVVLILFTCVPPIAFAAGLDGTWRIDQARRGGVTLHTFLVLHQNGATLDGKVIINDCVDLPLRKARLEGTGAIFRIDWGTEYRVQPDGDKLKVSIIYGAASHEDVTAVRAGENETTPPALIPVPAAEDVPANGLALTPPMGWNSWNHFGDKVDDVVVRATADAMAKNGMAAAGYVYINIDDTWEGGRDSKGNIFANEKFPDMKALADYVHQRGLKLGIYSSPGPKTCGGYEGSYGHEEQDARTFAAWGIDYLKYDWCSAGRIYPESALLPMYEKMGRALEHSGRAIVFSLCEYGMGDVWKWGPRACGNLWRTTGDIEDNWKSMTKIGFDQGRLAPFAAPGHWNDPDMLEVGNGGMTATEYRTHFSLWCLLAAPLMAGNDLRSMSAETLSILANQEVVAIDQDALGKQGQGIAERDGLEIWSKPMVNGACAIGIFNRSEAGKTASLSWKDLGLSGAPAKIRDAWEHRDVTASGDSLPVNVAAHGVVVLIVK